MNNDFIRKFGKPDQHFDYDKAEHSQMTRNVQLEPHHVDDLIANGRHHDMLRNPSLTPKHVHDALMDGIENNDGYVIAGAVANPNISDEDLDHVIGKSKAGSRMLSEVITSKNLKAHHIDKILDKILPADRQTGAISELKSLQPHHVDRLVDHSLEHNSSFELGHFLTNNKLEPRHIDKIVDSDFAGMHAKLYDAGKLSDHHIDKLLGTSPGVLPEEMALGHQPIKPEHFDKILSITHPTSRVRSFLYSRKDLTPEQRKRLGP